MPQTNIKYYIIKYYTQYNDYKKRISVYAIASVVAVMASIGMVYSLTSTQDTHDIRIQEPPAPDGYSPHLQTIRSGTPTLESIEIENPRLDNLDFQELNKNELPYIWRAINTGATFLSDKELEDYFTNVEEPRHRFTITDEKGNVKYYRLSYASPPLDYESHWFKSLEFAEERSIAFRAADKSSEDKMSTVVDRPYRWVQVDDQTALDLKQKLDREGSFYSAATSDRGSIEIQLQYLGPYSDYMSNEDFTAMLSQLSEEEKDHHE